MSDTQHKYYNIAYRAHAGMSFTPEKRAKSECEWYDSVCEEFQGAGKDWAVEKFTRLFLKALSARSRCYSSMITGPARFPVERMKKYNQWERNASDALLAFIEKVRKPKPEPRTELNYNIQPAEYSVGDVGVLHNVEENRLQLFFNGKPKTETLSKLKGRGFKWSPRNKAWQRQLTTNALYALGDVFPGFDTRIAIAKARGGSNG